VLSWSDQGRPPAHSAPGEYFRFRQWTENYRRFRHARAALVKLHQAMLCASSLEKTLRLLHPNLPAGGKDNGPRRFQYDRSFVLDALRHGDLDYLEHVRKLPKRICSGTSSGDKSSNAWQKPIPRLEKRKSAGLDLLVQ